MKNPMRRFVLGVVALVAGLSLIPHEAQAGAAGSGPLKNFYVRQVTATTTASDVYSLLSAADQLALDGRCAVTLYNISASVILNVGGIDVDNSTKFVPICGTSSCLSDHISLGADWKTVKFRTQSSTVTVYALFGGGC